MDVNIEWQEGDWETLEEKIISTTVWKLSSRIESAVEERFQAKLDEAIEAQCAKIVEDKFSPIVDEVLSKGFVKTNNYGEATGSISIEEYIRECVTPKDRGSSRGEWVKRTFEKGIKEVWNKELEAERKTAIAKIRKAVDQRIAEVLAKATREAAGLS